MTKFELPLLEFEITSFEPVLSAKSFEYHYGKHHKAYVDNLNKLLPQDGNLTLQQIIRHYSQQADLRIYNNASQHANHSFLWQSITPNPQPIEDKMMQLVVNSFETLDIFYEQFVKSAVTLFGSGWIWLAITKEKSLQIMNSKDGDGLWLNNNVTPLLVCDVWEHAYYIDYYNNREDYVRKFIKLFNWKAAEQKFSSQES